MVIYVDVIWILLFEYKRTVITTPRSDRMLPTLGSHIAPGQFRRPDAHQLNTLIYLIKIRKSTCVLPIPHRLQTTTTLPHRYVCSPFTIHFVVLCLPVSLDQFPLVGSIFGPYLFLKPVAWRILCGSISSMCSVLFFCGFPGVRLPLWHELPQYFGFPSSFFMTCPYRLAYYIFPLSS